ncbi:MAG: carboxypeptidase-like regulatory domain-containing protein [Terriglobia bacterium]
MSAIENWSKRQSKSTGAVYAFAVLVSMVMLATAPLDAQEARGTIMGKVTDPNKAVIYGASVKITNVAMGTTVSLVTNDAGFYQAPFLIPGTYQIVVETAGLKKPLLPLARSDPPINRTTHAASS